MRNSLTQHKQITATEKAKYLISKLSFLSDGTVNHTSPPFLSQHSLVALLMDLKISHKDKMGLPPPQFPTGRAAPQVIEREEFLLLLIMEITL